MGYMNEFPHSRMFDSDLRELLEMFEEVTKLPNAWEIYQEVMNGKFDTLKKFVENYFDNLDIQTEINNKLDSMMESGELLILLERVTTPTFFLADINDPQSFIDRLGDYPKILVIRKGEIVTLNRYINIPSNTRITGGGTLKFEKPEVNLDVFNPAIMLLTDVENIVFDGITINTNINIVCSVMRIKNCSNVRIENCTFDSITENSGYNASIDLHKNNKIVVIKNNIIRQLNDNLNVGSGLIWVQNAYNDAESELGAVTRWITIEDNLFESNCRSEFVAVYIYNEIESNIENVNINGNKFLSTADRRSGFFVTIFSKDGQDNKIKNVNITNNIFTNNAAVLTEQKAMLRIGGENSNGLIENLHINKNIFNGLLAVYDYCFFCNTNVNSYVYYVCDNIIKNDSADSGNVVGLGINNSGPFVDNNVLFNIARPLLQTPYAKVGRNFNNNVDCGYGGVLLTNENANNNNGNITFSNGITIEWKQVSIDTNNGSYVDVPMVNDWLNGTLCLYMVTPIYISALSTSAHDVDLYATPIGHNSIRVYNYGSNYGRVNIMCITKK